MDITTSLQQGRVPVTILHVAGKMDAHTSADVYECAVSEYAKGSRYMILDLTHTNYLSSAGLKAIQNIFDLLRKDVPQESNLEIKKQLHGSDFKSSRLKILNPPLPVRQVLTIGGFDMYLEIHDDLKKAVDSF